MTTWKIEYEIRSDKHGQRVIEHGWQKVQALTEQSAHKKLVQDLWRKNYGIVTILSVQEDADE